MLTVNKETPVAEMVIEMQCRWGRFLAKTGESGLEHLRREMRRMIMTPEAIAEFNRRVRP